MKFKELKHITNDFTNFKAFKEIYKELNSTHIPKLPQEWKNWLFIQKSITVHGNKYDYSKINYINVDTKVTIICPIHGEFQQTSYHHLKGYGCIDCGGGGKLTIEKFIEKAKKVHGDKYNYSKVVYKNHQTKVMIMCLYHGDFQQTPNKHVSGKQGCPKCITPNVNLTTKEFIEKAELVHSNKYNYSKVSYVNNKTKVTIICSDHGEFRQAPYHHLNGHGCKQCGFERDSKMKLFTTKEFIKKAKEVHNNKYNYSRVVYKNSESKVTIICPIHGEFQQMSNNHLGGSKCPRCSESKGESKISDWLEKNNIRYEREYHFNKHSSLKTGRSNYLRFDFFLLDRNILIEYDGEQHYRPKVVFGGKKEFEKIQQRDQIKNQFATDNNIKLIRIPYTDYNKIEKILKKQISHV